MTDMVECPLCHGAGENAVPGTYGITVSPENLELVQCWLCLGWGEVTRRAAEKHMRGEDDGESDDGGRAPRPRPPHERNEPAGE